MSTVIRNGTIVTADLSYSADVLVDNGVITDIRDNLSGVQNWMQPAVTLCRAV